MCTCLIGLTRPSFPATVCAEVAYLSGFQGSARCSRLFTDLGFWGPILCEDANRDRTTTGGWGWDARCLMFKWRNWWQACCTRVGRPLGQDAAGVCASCCKDSRCFKAAVLQGKCLEQLPLFQVEKLVASLLYEDGESPPLALAQIEDVRFNLKVHPATLTLTTVLGNLKAQDGRLPQVITPPPPFYQESLVRSLNHGRRDLYTWLVLFFGVISSTQHSSATLPEPTLPTPPPPVSAQINPSKANPQHIHPESHSDGWVEVKVFTPPPTVQA